MQSLRFLTVYASDQTVTLVRLTSSYTIMGMVSAVGGTLGLFTGFSVLSLVEIG